MVYFIKMGDLEKESKILVENRLQDLEDYIIIQQKVIHIHLKRDRKLKINYEIVLGVFLRICCSTISY